MWWAWLITAGYLLVLVFLVNASKPCEGTIESSFWQKLSCRSTNEIGDFLAGAFAPLAFFWLVATVLTQAKELAAQREELSLTRQEMNASTKQLTAQTNLFEDEKADRNRSVQVAICEKMLEDVKASTLQLPETERLLYIGKDGKRQHITGFQSIKIRSAYCRIPEMFENELVRYQNSLSQLINWILNAKVKEELSLDSNIFELLDCTRDYVEIFCESYKKLDNVGKERIFKDADQKQRKLIGDLINQFENLEAAIELRNSKLENKSRPEPSSTF